MSFELIFCKFIKLSKHVMFVPFYLSTVIFGLVMFKSLDVQNLGLKQVCRERLVNFHRRRKLN